MNDNCQTPAARIPTRSRRRAMDWSLVLASQSIQAVIENTPEAGWALVVAAPDYARAIEVIRQYRRENLRWQWRRPVFKSDVLFDWGSAAWVLLTLVFFRLEMSRTDFRDIGIMDNAALARGEWWRLFTATWLHADPAHLAMNAVFGFVLLGMAMGRYGTGVGLLAAYLAGVGGNLATWLIYGQTHRGLGASGVVMGALGLLALPSVSLLNHHPYGLKYALGGIAGGMMLFVLLALDPGADVLAHLGGFVSGLLLGAALAWFPKLTRSASGNLAAGFVFAILVAATWALALSHAPGSPQASPRRFDGPVDSNGADVSTETF